MIMEIVLEKGLFKSYFLNNICERKIKVNFSFSAFIFFSPVVQLEYRFLHLFQNIKSQNHKIIDVGRDIKVILFSSPAQAGAPKAGCQRPCPDDL